MFIIMVCLIVGTTQLVFGEISCIRLSPPYVKHCPLPTPDNFLDWGWPLYKVNAFIFSCLYVSREWSHTKVYNVVVVGVVVVVVSPKIDSLKVFWFILKLLLTYWSSGVSWSLQPTNVEVLVTLSRHLGIVAFGPLGGGRCCLVLVVVGCFVVGGVAILLSLKSSSLSSVMLVEETAELVWGWMPKGPASTSSVVPGPAEVHASDCCAVPVVFVVLHAGEVNVSDSSLKSCLIVESGSCNKERETQSLVGYDKYAN
jgi:hypothetical protein